MLCCSCETHLRRGCLCLASTYGDVRGRRRQGSYRTRPPGPAVPPSPWCMSPAGRSTRSRFYRTPPAPLKPTSVQCTTHASLVGNRSWRWTSEGRGFKPPAGPSGDCPRPYAHTRPVQVLEGSTLCRLCAVVSADLTG